MCRGYNTVDATKSLARSFFGLVVPVQKAVHEQASAAAKGARRIRCETRRWCGDRATPPESTSSKKGGRVLGVVRWLSAWEAWWAPQGSSLGPDDLESSALPTELCARKPARKAFTRGRRLAKRPADVQQGDRVFPVVPAAGGNARSRGIPGFSSPCAVHEDLGLEALRSAAVTMIPAATVVTAILLAVGSAIEAAAAPASAETAFHARQDRQPALLALVQSLVQ